MSELISVPIDMAISQYSNLNPACVYVVTAFEQKTVEYFYRLGALRAGNYLDPPVNSQ